MNDRPDHVDPLDLIALREALQKLPPMQQEIMWMHYWLGRSLDEIGKTLGPKYRGKVLTGSAIRYYLKQIFEDLRSSLDVD